MEGEKLTKDVSIACVFPDMDDQSDDEQASRGGVGGIGSLEGRGRVGRTDATFAKVDALRSGLG